MKYKLIYNLFINITKETHEKHFSATSNLRRRNPQPFSASAFSFGGVAFEILPFHTGIGRNRERAHRPYTRILVNRASPASEDANPFPPTPDAQLKRRLGP